MSTPDPSTVTTTKIPAGTFPDAPAPVVTVAPPAAETPAAKAEAKPAAKAEAPKSPTAPEAKADPAPSPAPDAAGELAAMRARLAEMESAAKATAEAQAKTATELGRLREQARIGLMSQAGIDPADHALVPDFDPSTDAGRAALEAFLRAHPRLVARAPAAPAPVAPKLSDAKRNRLINTFGMSEDALRRMGH